jgi:hypothetical protein
MSSVGGEQESYMKINFERGPNAFRVGPGEILKFQPVQTSVVEPFFRTVSQSGVGGSPLGVKFSCGGHF